MLPRTKSKPVPVWGKWLIGILLAAIAAFLLLSSSFTPRLLEAGSHAATLARAIAILIVLTILYLLPSVFARGTPRFAAILVLNLTLGWTILGWLAALIWALAEMGSMNKKPTP